MSYRFRVWFSGLCHFVENRDPNARCSLCVVLPDATSDLRRHVAAIYTVEREQDNCGKLRVVKGEEIFKFRSYPNRYRVAFELTKADNIATLEPFEIVEGTLLRMGDIAGGYSDENTEIVSAYPPHNVITQILLESSRIDYDYTLSVVRDWTIPATLTGEPRRTVRVADPVFVEFSDIRRVRLIATPIDNPTTERIEWPLSPVGETIEVFVANRCDDDCEDEPGLVELRWESERRVSWVQIDTDFEHNFRMLHPSTLAAIDRLLPRDTVDKAKYPLPESPLLTLEVAPHLCLDVDEELEFEEILEFLKEIVTKGTGSGSGNDCLGSRGLVRFVDLDQFLPEPQPIVPALQGKARSIARGAVTPAVPVAEAGAPTALAAQQSPTATPKKAVVRRARPRDRDGR